MTWLSKLLCWIGCHDWRNMDGVCCECHYRDPLWHDGAGAHCADIIAAFNERFNEQAGPDVKLVACNLFDHGKKVEIEIEVPALKRRHFIGYPLDRGVDTAIRECAWAARHWASAQIATQ